MKISVIIPFYKNISHLEKCLSSLAEQTCRDLEIILVNDGSPLAAENLSRRQADWKMVTGNLQIFKQKHLGPAFARNLGASKARGEILVFVDADMTFDKNFIKDLVAPIIKGKTKGTFSKNEYTANWKNIWAKYWNYSFGLKYKRKIPINYPDTAPVFRAILKKEFDRVKGFESTGYADDWTLSKKLGYKAQAVKGAVYYHYNPQNLSEVFYQAKWRSKRGYKLGVIGELWALFLSLFPFSIVIGLYKSIKFKEPGFIIFKIVFDFGTLIGLLEKLIFKNYY